MAEPRNALRERLRAATAGSHARLDTMMGALDLGERGDYATFLRIQHAARGGVEDWLAAHAPAELCPPAALPAIERDLADLGLRTPPAGPAFEPGPQAEPLGPAWVLAGSSLGNRMMLGAMRKRGDADLPTRFLADEAAHAHWKALTRAMADDPADPDRAAASAQATFAHFAALATAYLPHAPA